MKNFKPSVETTTKTMSRIIILLLIFNWQFSIVNSQLISAAKVHKILLDTDPGIDDAAAIAIALTDDQFDVKLLTTVDFYGYWSRMQNDDSSNMPLAEALERAKIFQYKWNGKRFTK